MPGNGLYHLCYVRRFRLKGVKFASDDLFTYLSAFYRLLFLTGPLSLALFAIFLGARHFCFELYSLFRPGVLFNRKLQRLWRKSIQHVEDLPQVITVRLDVFDLDDLVPDFKSCFICITILCDRRDKTLRAEDLRIKAIIKMVLTRRRDQICMRIIKLQQYLLQNLNHLPVVIEPLKAGFSGIESGAQIDPVIFRIIVLFLDGLLHGVQPITESVAHFSCAPSSTFWFHGLTISKLCRTYATYGKNQRNIDEADLFHGWHMLQ